MPKINYYLDLGVLGEDVDCVVSYDYTKADRNTNCDAEISIYDVVIQGVVLSPENLSCLIADLNGDETLLDKIHEREDSRWEDDAAARAEAMEER